MFQGGSQEPLPTSSLLPPLQVCGPKTCHHSALHGNNLPEFFKTPFLKKGYLDLFIFCVYECFCQDVCMGSICSEVRK